MRNSKLQQENEQHSLTCEQLSQENQQKALELKVNTVCHVWSLALPSFVPVNNRFAFATGALVLAPLRASVQRGRCKPTVIASGPEAGSLMTSPLLLIKLIRCLCKCFLKQAQMFISVISPASNQLPGARIHSLCAQ